MPGAVRRRLSAPDGAELAYSPLSGMYGHIAALNFGLLAQGYSY